MCGITGILRFNEKPVLKDEIQGMLNVMPYRGPDDSGVFLDGNLGLGHLRLSILDLSTLGHQPMKSQDGRYLITYNGEIYNYKELANKLKEKGWHFQTSTDTEVILAAFQQWGVASFNKFNGMWAFAIWDSKERTLICSRDRFGIKPFYFSLAKDTLIFASEIKAIISHPDIEPKVNGEVLGRFLKFRKKPEDFSSSFEDITQLKPAHYAIIKEGQFKQIPYWTLPEKNVDINAYSEQEYADQLENIFSDSVNLRLRSDVPVGACLSGGIDSSAIVGEIDQTHVHNFKTFSVSYNGKEYDESSYVKAVINQCQNIVPNLNFPDGNDCLEIIRKSTWHYDEPTWNAAAYSWWHVMKLAHKNQVTVILNGQGADELFAGYPTYYLSYLRQELVNGNIDKFINELSFIKKKNSMTYLSLLKLLASPMLNRQRSLFGLPNNSPITEFLDRDFSGFRLKDEQSIDTNGYWSLKSHLRDDLSWSRLPMLLQAEDRFSMAFSLESRVPWLDYRLVEFAQSTPDPLLLNKGETKVLIKKALNNRIPKQIINRTDKKGYSTPADSWLTKDLQSHVFEYLSSGIIDRQDIFDRSKLKAIINSSKSASIPNNIWQILSVLMWYEMFFCKDTAYKAG